MASSSNRNLQNLPKWVVALGAILLLTLIAYIDYATPPEFSMGLFYILPLALVTWFLGKRSGYVMALVAAATELTVELFSPSPSYTDIRFAYWNALTRLAFFLFCVPALSSLRTMGERLTKMVEARTGQLRAEVAERQRAEQAVRELAGQLSAVEDSERRRVAYDLHDGLGQMLSLLKINLEAVVSNAGAVRPNERLADSVRVVDSLIQQTRSLTFDLHPAMLDDLGLVATLHTYAGDFSQRVSIDVAVTEHGAGRLLPTTMAHYLFRAVKELLNNAFRHGKATEILIAVHWEPERVRVVVDDDGCGFDPAQLPGRKGPRGLGLPGIGERLQSFGGAVNIESSPGQGTRVMLEAPLDRIHPPVEGRDNAAPASSHRPDGAAT
jgi:signal transduction histidine kinase